MKSDNEAMSSGWRGVGVRVGLVSMMAATGMMLAGHAAHATPTVATSPGMQAVGAGEGLPLDLPRLDGGNSGAVCGGGDGGAGGDGDGGGQGGIGVNVLSGIGVLGSGAGGSAHGDAEGS